MNETKLEIGQIWTDRIRTQRKIEFIGKQNIFYSNTSDNIEASMKIEDFLNTHTLKKPEPKLTKLVAWVEVNNKHIIILPEISPNPIALGMHSKKQIIIKGDQLYIVEE